MLRIGRALFLALALSVILGGTLAEERAGMTLMVYLCGSDLESGAGAASQDLREMAEAMPEDGSLQIVALAGGSTRWASDIDPDAGNLYRLTPRGPELAEAGDGANMGEPGTLARLLCYGYEACPAERYALLLWDHGAGPMMGLCFDENHSDGQGMDALTLAELREALAASPFAGEKLAWIGFDACLMASVETACVVAPYAQYMIASQELEPGDGWCYSFIAQAAADADGAATGRRAADAYADYYEDSLSDITLSCVDLSQMEAVEREMSALFGAFCVDEGTYAGFAAGRNEARSIGGAAYAYDLVDLCDLLEVYELEEIADCAALREALGRAIVYNRANGPYRNGLSVYYPFVNRARYTSPWASVADELGFCEGYRAFLAQSSAIWLGDSLADWTEPNHIAAAPGSQNRLTLMLNDDQAAQYASARLLVLEEGAPDAYKAVYSSGNVQLRGNELSCVYDGNALFVVDDAGLPRSYAMFYLETDDDIYTLAILYLPDETEAFGERMQLVTLRYRRDDAGVYRFAEVIENREDGLVGKSSLRLEDCNQVTIASKLRAPTTDGTGRLLPYTRWQYSDEVTGDVFLPGEMPDRLKFLPLEDGEPRWAMLEITDLQGQTWTSDLFFLGTESRLSLPVAKQTLLDCDACEVTLEGANMALGAHPALVLTFRAVNRADRMLRVQLDDYRFDDTLAEAYCSYAMVFLDPGEEASYRLRIEANVLRNARIRRLDELGLTVTCLDNGNREVIASATAAIPLRVDTRAMVGEPLDDAPLDSAEWIGLEIDLMSVARSPGGAPKALIRFVNPGEETVRIAWDLMGFEMNDVPVGGYFERDALVLPGGVTAYQWLTFYASEGGEALPERMDSLRFGVYAYNDNPYDRFDVTQRWGEAEIRLCPGPGEG